MCKVHNVGLRYIKNTIAAFAFKTPHVVEITLVAAMWHLLTGPSKDFRPFQHIFVAANNITELLGQLRPPSS
jgi:hypothetical protein